MLEVKGINAPIIPDESGMIPRADQVRGILMENAKIGLSMRYRRLQRLDSFYNATEYAHLKHDWNGYEADAVETISPAAALPPGFVQPALQAVDDIPLARRRPSAPARLTPTIVDRFTGMLFSEGRMPTVKVEGDPDADDFLSAVIKDSKLWKTMRQSRSHGGAMGSSLVTFRLSEGRFVFKAHNPKYVADIVWRDRDRWIPAGVLIQYVFHKEFDLYTPEGHPTGKTEVHAYVYRRIIDEQYDVTFKEAKLDEDGRPPIDMEIDEVQTFNHRLGTFPGVWIQNLDNGDDFDGIPDCDGAFQMMEEADRVKSQGIRALKYNMDPTLVTSRDIGNNKNVPPVIEKGNGVGIEVGAGGSASYLEISGNGITAAKETVEELRKDVLTKTQCVIPDPDSPAMQGQSGKALELAFAPMIEKGGMLREQYGDGIIRLCELVLEYARLWMQKTMYMGNTRAVFRIPLKIEERDPDPDNPDVRPSITMTERFPGVGGQVSIKWGPYFSATPADKQANVATLAAARMARFLDLETAVKIACELFDIEDPDGLLRKIREEQKEEEAKREQQFGFDHVEPIEEDPFESLQPPSNPPSGTPGGYS